jgi:hypothetical protein
MLDYEYTPDDDDEVIGGAEEKEEEVEAEEGQEQAATPATTDDPVETPAEEEEDDGLEDEDREYSERVQRRIAQKTKQHREQERRAEYWETEAKRLAESRATPEQPPVEVPPKGQEPTNGAPLTEPKEADYDTFEGYIDARVAYSTAKQQEQANQQQTYQDKTKKFDASMKEAEARIPDFKSKVYRKPEEGGPALSEAVYFAVMDSPYAGDVAFWLADNVEESKRIAGLSVREATLEIGMISAQFKKDAAPTAPPRTTNAPPPIPQKVGSANKGGTTNPDDLPIEEWMEKSKKGELRY